MALEALVAPIAGIASGIAGMFGGGGKTEYPITSSKRDREAAQMQAFANAMMTGATGYGGYKGKSITMPFALPPPLQQAYNQIKAMYSYQVPQEIDAATRMSQLQGTQLGEALAERGIGPGGQRSALEADIYQNLMENILGARRSGAMETAKYGAGMWEKAYGTATDWMKTLATGGGGGTTIPDTFAQNLGTLTQGAADFAGGLYGALSGGGTTQPMSLGPYNPNWISMTGQPGYQPKQPFSFAGGSSALVPDPRYYP